MNRKAKIAGLAISGLLAIAPSLSAFPRVVIRPSIGFGFGYRRYVAPVYPFYPVYPWPGAVIVPDPYVVSRPQTGELKIDTQSKNASVYVDGGYLGIVRNLKQFALKPGNHEIELRDGAGNVLLNEKIAIVPGGTTRIDAMGIGG